MVRISIVLLMICTALKVFAHGDVHERILIVDEEINADAKNPSLYVKRGMLYLEDGDFEHTLKDFEAAKLYGGEDFPPMLMGYSDMYAKLGANEAALKYIDRFLELEPVHVLGFRSKAAILTDMGKLNEAVLYQQKVIVHTSTPLPENYLSLVTNLEELDRIEEAVYYCQAAIRELGNLLVFELRIVDIYESTAQYDKAIQYLDKIIAAYERKEKWHFRKAQILAKADQQIQAQEELTLAEECIKKLPQRIRLTPAMQQLISDISFEREQLETSWENTDKLLPASKN